MVEDCLISMHRTGRLACLLVVDARGHLASYSPCWVTEKPCGGFRVDYVRNGEDKTDNIDRNHVVSLRYYG